MYVKKVTMFYILSLYNDSIPNILKYYIKNDFDKNIIYAIFNDYNTMLGLSIFNTHTYNLTYIYIFPEYRKKGVASKLIKEMFNDLKINNVSKCYTRTVLNDDSIEPIFKHFGFTPINKSNIIKCLINEENYKKWCDYSKKKQYAIEKWNSINNLMTVSFKDADDSIKKSILDVNSDFPKELNPKVINDGTCGSFLEDLSFITIKNNNPVAYSILTKINDDSLVFAQLSTSNEYKRSGVCIDTFFKSMESILKSSYKSVSYTVLDDNIPMLKLTENMVSNLTCKITSQIYWVKNIV